MPMQRRTFLTGVGAAAMAAAPLAAWSQAPAWPSRPIRLVVAFAPAGPADIIARLMAQKLTETLGQPVVVENRPGAGGSLASGQVARAEPDGYTLLVNTSSYAVNPSMQRSLGFDAEKDLVLASVVASSPNLITLAPGLKARTLKEVMEAARSGDWNYGTAGAGTTPHLTAEYIFKVLGKVPVTHVPYQGAGPALNAAMAGQVQLASVALPAAVELVKGGRVRGLVVTGSRRSRVLPDVPTVAESGFPGFEDVTWVGVFAPGRTPDAVVQRVNREIARLQQDHDFQAKLAATGFEPQGGSVAESREYLRSELAKWARVVKETGAQAL
ncbi:MULTISPECIES: tripartite tricarboxylate transporter substrate binding protein [Ramlibacter]|uniref:Tripartite tricarboxylate transporter substrate binding protein n=1 Tax=Ramlibacter pinisoli TaxID=2682844 RepID=A0A6N8IP66_9BURK|nr:MULTISPECIES: tripartite tricarboxylate transporter substrate binding protein [Ramlibacter]MBA2963546.1 tripartite tricarboxylate transporter substrate binding protein [Ramlibacter sp. CGMCC 1.13660]MVQ28512.1 tripartite tricarboxylate transporter substrate binding protein [Ramlibacter pinisoli]